jgi:hypothetical protein
MKKKETNRSKIRMKNEPAEETNEVRTAAGTVLYVIYYRDVINSKVVAPGGELSEELGASFFNQEETSIYKRNYQAGYMTWHHRKSDPETEVTF